MPELTPIDEWAAINDISDSVEKRKKYSAYMKAEFLREGIEGETMRETFGAIDQSLLTGLQQDGLNEEEIAEALKPSQATFEDKFKIVDRALGVVTDNDDLRALSDYDAFQKITSEQTDLPPDYLARGDELRMRAEEVVNANYEDAAQWMSVNEDVPFTRITLGDGTVRLLGNNAAVGLTPLQAYEKSLAMGSIKEEDIDTVLRLMQKDEKGFEAFRHERFAETSKALGDAMKDDEVLNNNLSVMIGEYGRNGQVSDVSRDTFKTTLLSKIPAMNGMYSDADVNAALDYMVGQQAMMSGEAPFDFDNPTSGVRDFGYGYTTLHIALLQNKEQFDEATANMPPEKVKVFELQRDAYRAAIFPHHSESLERSSVGDEWTEFYATKKVEGMEDADILDAFLEGKDYNWLFANVQHLALGVGEGFTDVMWGIGAAMDNDAARENLLENMRDREARRITARLFGHEMGFGMQVAEVAAPIIADILSTFAMTTATGALGAGTAVAGSLAKNAMKSTFRNTIQSVAKNAAVDLGQVTAKQAVPTIRKFSETYAGIVGSKATGYAAMFTSAATRSGTMTYANVYDVLKRENDANGGALTDEEIHQKALGAGLTAGAITGSITFAFSKMGAGGVEDFILNRATGKDVKRVFDALSRRELTDAQYQAALSKVLANGHEEFTKKAGVGVVKRMAVGAAGEAAEEGADEYFNSIVQAVATNQDLSFLEVASQAGMGAVFGGILGAGTPAISRAYRAVTRKLDGGIGDEVARREVESKVAEQAANLVESGSPVTAEVFQQAMATAPERMPQTPADAEEAPADAEEAPADAEEAPADAEEAPDVITTPDVTQFDQELGEFEPDSPIYAADIQEPVDVALPLLSPLAQDTLAKVEAFNNGESAWASAPDLIKARNEIRLYREELEKQTGTERLTEFAGMLELEQQLDDEIEARKAGGRNQLFGHLFDGINLPPDEVEEAVAEAKSAKKKKPKVKQATVKVETPPAARMKATQRTGVTPQTRVEVTPPPAARMKATQRTGVTPQTRVEVTPPPKVESVDTFLGSRVTPDITEEDKQEYLQELQEKFGLSLEEAQEALEQSIVDAANETDTGDLDDGEDEPNTPEEEKTVEDTFKERVDELIQLGLIVNINSGTHGLPTGLKRDFIKAEKERLVREIKALQKDKKSDRHVLPTAAVLKAFGVSADTVEKRAAVPNATGELLWHSEYGYLFNNDPLVVKEALKRNQPVVLPDGYDGPFNADLFVVIDGRVTEVKEPQRVGGEQKKTKAEIASQDVSDALARSFELINAFNPSDVEVTFRQAGFSPKRVFAEASKRIEGESDEEYVERLEQLERDLTVGADQIFVLDESMTVKEAIKHFRRWAGGLYAGLIESHRTIDVYLYRNAANIKRMGLPKEQTDEILASSVADFVADIEASIHMQGLRQKLEPLMTDGSLASADMDDIMNALFDSDIARELNLAGGLLSMRAIDSKLKELGNLQWGKTTTAKTDLIAQADTPAKKLAAFLYYVTAGKGTKVKGMVSDEEFNKSIVGFAHAKAFKAGWEEKIVKRSLESLLDIEQFKPKPNAPFPNFMTAARRVGDRVRKRSEGFRVENKQKRAEVDLETVQVTPDTPLEPDTVKNFYDTFRYGAGLRIDREILSLPEEQRTEVVDILKNLMVRTYGLRETILQEQGEDVLGFTTESFRSIVTHFLKELTKQRVAGNPNVLSGGRAGNYFAQNYKKLPLNTTRYLVIAGFQPPFDLPTDDIISLDDAQEEVLYEFGQFKAPNLLNRKAAQLYRAKNNEDMVRLGLVDGNPQSVVDALEEIKKNGVDESHRLVAGLLLRNKGAILNTAIEIIDNPDSGYAGLYDESAKKVTLNLSSSYGSGLESVLLHEYLHVATVGLLRSDNLSRKQRAALTRLQNLRLLVRDAYERSGKRHIAIDNGVSNNEEFVASVFTSVAFQNAVRSLPEKGWFRRILNAVKDFFGIPPKDKLRKAFDDLVDFLNMEQAPKERVIDSLGGRKFFAPNDNARIVQDALDKLRAYSEAEKQQRYSDPILFSVDEQYLQAVADGDMKTVERMVKEAAAAAGYVVGPVWHTTKAKTWFTKFDLTRAPEGFHFGPIETAIDRQSETGSETDIKPFFLKGKIIDVEDWEGNEASSVALQLLDSNTLTRKEYAIVSAAEDKESFVRGSDKDSFPEYYEELKKNFREVENEIGRSLLTPQEELNKILKGELLLRYINMYESKYGYESPSYFVFSPNQIKSAEPIIKDEAGNVIPLSERFNLNLSDVRYSPLDGIDSDDTLTPEQRRTMDSLIDEVIGMTVPADVPVVEMVEGNADLFADRPNALFATTYSQIGGKQVVTILLNRNAAQSALFEMTNQVYDTTHVKAILESILNEEIVHAAELRTIAPAELDAVLEEMVEDDLLNTVDDYTDNLVRRNELKTAIQNGDQNIRRQMLGELLRMKAQRITRGYTTEQDKAFYATNPRFHQVMLRYLMGVFKRFAAKRNLRKDNPEMARMVNKMAYEVALLRSGVFRIAERLHFDINSPDANVADLERRFSATFEDEPEKEITEATTTEEIKNRYPLFKAFDIALGSFTEGEYKANTGIMRMLNGDLDPRIMELRRQADAVKQAVDTNAKAIFKEVSEMVQNDPNIDDETLADFLGRPNDMDLPEGYLQAREKVFQERYRREVNERGRVTSEEREAMRKEEVTDKATNELARMIDSAKSKQAAAKRYINRNNPALYRKLMELRNFLDSLSKIFTEQFDTQGKLRAVVDTRLGVYVVRAYRAFLEEGYLDRIIKIAKGEAKAGDETMVRQYQMVYELFEETYHRRFAKEERKRERKNGVPEQDRATFESLIEASTEELNRLREKEGQDPIRGAIIDYLYSLDPNTKYAHSHTNIANSVTKSLVSNIRKREQLPLALRQLLGQYDDADALNNIMRSIYTVGHAASNESFITNMIRLGRVEGAKFIYNIEEVRKMQSTEEGRTKTANMVNLRTGGRVNEAVLRKETTGDEVETDYSKALDYYVDKEILDQLRMQFQRDATSDLSFEKKKVEQFFNVWKTLTGASLGAKTLFSIGYYIRNVFGALTFLAPLQGLNPIKVAKKLGHVTKALKGQAGQIDAYTAELTSLNLIQGDLTVRTVQDLLRGKTTLEQQEEEIGKVTEKIRALKAKGKKVSEKTLEPMMNYLMDLSQAVDAFYKIAAYEHELDYQKKARAHDIANGKDTGFLDLSDYDLKTRAAKKVRQTSQSYVDAYESVKYATKKWSFILAPFLRFRFDIIRIMFDGTPKLIRQEIKSDNPIERKRGIQRLAGFVGTIGGMSFTIPLALRMMSGIGEEEEELLREGYLPDYQKNATLWFFGKDKFVDATFLNPLGSVTDPLLRAFEHSLNGDFNTSAVTLIKMLGEEYGGQQILSSAVASAIANKDARTGDPIYEEDDGLIQVWKFMKYVYLEAYNPRVALAGSRALEAAVGDEATKWDRSVAGIISREFMPSRLTDIDWERALRNGISKKQDERNRMRSALNKLRSSGSLTDGDIESATDTFVRGQQKVDSDLSNYILAARNMGVSDMEIDRSLEFYKISKDRVSDLRYGRFRRPDIPEPLATSLQEMGAVGVERLQKAYARLREYPSFSFLD